MKSSIFIKSAIAMMAAVALGASNASATVVSREKVLLETVISAEGNVTQKGIIQRVKVSQPAEAKKNDKGVTGETGFGEISVSFSEPVKLKDVTRTEYATDTEAGAAVKTTSEVGMLLQTEEVKKHEQFVKNKWDLSLPRDVKPVSFDDGSIGFRTDTENGVSAVSETRISTPWAVDKHGNPLETWYEISSDGSSITQVVNTQDIEGEIVLDPRITYGQGVYYNWYGSELRTLKAESAVTFALAVGYGCVNVNRLRHPALVAVAGLMCMTVGSTVGFRALRFALDNFTESFKDHSCYQWKFGSHHITPVAVKGNCSL